MGGGGGVGGGVCVCLTFPKGSLCRASNALTTEEMSIGAYIHFSKQTLILKAAATFIKFIASPGFFHLNLALHFLPLEVV